jgi:acyl-CoA thioesterase FadM
MIEFHGPAAMDEEIIVGAGISRIGTTSVTFAFEVARASDGAPRAQRSLSFVWTRRR